MTTPVIDFRARVPGEGPELVDDGDAERGDDGDDGDDGDGDGDGDDDEDESAANDAIVDELGEDFRRASRRFLAWPRGAFGPRRPIDDQAFLRFSRIRSPAGALSFAQEMGPLTGCEREPVWLWLAEARAMEFVRRLDRARSDHDSPQLQSLLPPANRTDGACLTAPRYVMGTPINAPRPSWIGGRRTFLLGDDDSELVPTTEPRKPAHGDELEAAGRVIEQAVRPRILTSATTTFRFHERSARFELRFAPSTLLEAMWLQMALELGGRARFEFCASCDRPFEKSASGRRADAKYCSDACRSAAQTTRNHRVVELYSAGMDPTTIASVVGVGLAAVKAHLARVAKRNGKG